MKILLTGATGYIGRNLLPELVSLGHTVVCCVRNRKRFLMEHNLNGPIQVIEVDFLDEASLRSIPSDIDGAYYLIHSMASSTKDFRKLEALSALNFRNALARTHVKHVVYLGGIVNQAMLSSHLASRKQVEDILSDGPFQLTTLRAGIIIGKGSASFEIIRDLVEKLPVMVAPKWLQTRSQPLALQDAIKFLSGTLFHEKTYGRTYDIGGQDVLSYKEMLMQYAKARKLRRLIIMVPVMTPRLSSYWLYFVTSTPYFLAVNLVNSMKVEVVAKSNDLSEQLGITPKSYWEAVLETL